MLKRLFIRLCSLCSRMSRLCGAIALAERGDFDRVRDLRGDAARPGRRP